MPNEIIPYIEMCTREDTSLQRCMIFLCARHNIRKHDRIE